MAMTPDRSGAFQDENFRLLLARLGADPESGGAEFERLRRALMRFFDWRGASWPEECADETLDRLAKKLGEGTAILDLPAFAHGIARMVLRENLRSGSRRSTIDFERRVDSPAEPEGNQFLAQRLDLCLDELPQSGRELVLAYYSESGGRDKIETRQRLARRLRLTDNALRSRVQRLRDRLEDCVRGAAVAGSGSHER
jgi:DNA-directed RNA polymerase specialized sigma24 family protein